ncbi:MAG: ZIP family metal transporter [Aureliella sp.]
MHFPDHTFGLMLAYSGAVVLASVWGGMLPEWLRLTHTRMQLLISFVGGLMLGIAVFHMIPHALAASGQAITSDDVSIATTGLMLGLVAMFLLLRFFHFHQHGPGDFGIAPTTGDSLAVREEMSEQDGEVPGGQTHNGEHSHDCADHSHSSPSLTMGKHRWIGVLVGLGLHTLLDGVALASGVVTELGHGANLAGFGIFLAVFLHKPLDAVSVTSLMYPTTTPNQRLVINVGFALMCPLGAFGFLYGASSLGGEWAAHLAAWGLAFSAGVFLCISLSDLLPEMEFHSHSRIPLTAALLLGITAAWLVGLLEGEHAHGPESEGGSDPVHLHGEIEGGPHEHTGTHDHPH